MLKITRILLNSFKLFQNYPNPFNPTTTISYTIPSRGIVTLNVYDILGNKIKQLVSGFKQKGSHKVVFNGSSLASGVYFYRITFNSSSNNNSQNLTSTKKLIILK